MIEAAGGVVWRIGSDGRLEIVVVHRPRFDDWSLPKGKLDDGESHREAARREVAEETGLRCRLDDELPSVRYRDPRGRPKRVRYWLMEPVEGRLTAAGAPEEVDRVRWVRAGPAAALLTYDLDRTVLRAAAAIVAARHPGSVDQGELGPG